MPLRKILPGVAPAQLLPALLLPALLAALLLKTATCPAGTVEILTTTDIHGRAENLTLLAPHLRRNPDALRIDCGDTIQGTLLSRHSDGRVMMALLNELDFDVWVPGNHDFEFGPEALIAAAAQFKGRTLGAEYHRAGFRPPAWALFERCGYRIAVIGMTDPKQPTRFLPGSGWTFETNRDALRRVMPEVLGADPHLIVLAWHSGMHTPPGSMFRFLAEFPEVDLVIGAHSHELVRGRKIGGAWFVQAGKYAECVGRIRVEFDDRTGQLIRITSDVLEPEPAPDAAVRAVLEPYLQAYREFADRVVAELPVVLRLPEKGAYDAPVCRLGARAFWTAGGTDGAMFSIAALPQFEAGPVVTEAGLFTLFPYENQLCEVFLTRSELRDLLTEAIVKSRQGRSVFAFAGLPVTVDGKGAYRIADLNALPERISLTVTSYSMTASEVLRRKFDGNDWRLLPLDEREAVRRFLKQNPHWESDWESTAASQR